MLVIKLDFEKAFETIERNAIIDIFRAKGFGEKLISWMQLIFSSTSSAVMLNGVPGKKILHRKRSEAGGSLLSINFCAGY